MALALSSPSQGPRLRLCRSVGLWNTVKQAQSQSQGGVTGGGPRPQAPASSPCLSPQGGAPAPSGAAAVKHHLLPMLPAARCSCSEGLSPRSTFPQ